jgi:hypothetical protein
MTTWRHISFLDPSFFRSPGGNLSNIGDPFDLGNGVYLTHLQSYLRDPPIWQSLDAYGRELLRDTAFVLQTEFEANDTNPDEQMSQAFDRAFSASAAIWLCRACPIGIHNAVNLERVGEADQWCLRAHVPGLQRFPTHPDDAEAWLTAADLQRARNLNITLEALAENTPTWTAKWFVWLALPQKHWDVRYLCLWSALEALFGADGKRTYQMCRELAAFLEQGNTNDAREGLLRDAQAAYAMRGIVTHGSILPRGLTNERKLTLLRTVETWMRRSLLRIVEDATLSNVFRSDRDRNEYLARLARTTG